MIKDKLYSLKDDKYREFSYKLLPPKTNIIGVRLPVLRNLSKRVELSELTDNTFEEVMLQGMIIARSKDFNDFKIKCECFLPKINNWSICDSFVASLKITNVYPKEMLIYLKSLISSQKEYIRRFVLVMLLRYYISDSYIDEILEIIKNINKDGYFVKMALSWLIAEVYLKYRDRALDILSDNTYNLDRFIFLKTISKIKDSKKVEKPEKEKLDVFKKKYLSIWELR